MNHLGGENQQTSLNRNMGYSDQAHCTGNPVYLEPNSRSMQKPIGGRSVLALFTTKNKTCHTKVQPINNGGIACSKRVSPSKTSFKTLIPHDTTLISAILASNRKQQHRIRYPKRDATPHPHGCGVKGERAAQREAQMTPCTGKSDAHTKRFSPNAKQTPPNGPTTPTPSGEWLGLRADEGRGKRRYSPG
jgi:hypothetical protein